VCRQTSRSPMPPPDLAHDLRVLVRERFIGGDRNEPGGSGFVRAAMGDWCFAAAHFEIGTAHLWGRPNVSPLCWAGWRWRVCNAGAARDAKTLSPEEDNACRRDLARKRARVSIGLAIALVGDLR